MNDLFELCKKEGVLRMDLNTSKNITLPRDVQRGEIAALAVKLTLERGVADTQYNILRSGRDIKISFDPSTSPF